MTYYEELQTMRKNNLDISNLIAANSTEWFLKDICRMKESDEKYHEYFEKVAEQIKDTYLYDDFSLDEIELSLNQAVRQHHLTVDDILNYYGDVITGAYENYLDE